MKYDIYRVIVTDEDRDGTLTPVEAQEMAGEFEELPAPHQTLGGHLMALKAETGFDHIAIPQEQADD